MALGMVLIGTLLGMIAASLALLWGASMPFAVFFCAATGTCTVFLLALAVFAHSDDPGTPPRARRPRNWPTAAQTGSRRPET